MLMEKDRIKKFLDSISESELDKTQEALVFSVSDHYYGGDNAGCSNSTLSACKGVNTNCTNYNAACTQSYNVDCKNVRVDNCPISPEI